MGRKSQLQSKARDTLTNDRDKTLQGKSANPNLKQDLCVRNSRGCTTESVLNAPGPCILKWLVLCCMDFTLILKREKEKRASKIHSQNVSSFQWR